MTLPEVKITVEQTAEGTIFHFTSADEPASAITLAVVRKGDQAPVWWLVPEAAVHEFPFTVVGEPGDRGTTASADIATGLSEAELERKLIADRSNSQLGSISYGDVPSGFRQALPRTGPPPSLQSGVVYVVSVLGACQGQAEFRA